MNLEENKLIEGCLANNPIAQKQLYDLFSKKMYGICLRFSKNEEEAQDILQDGFIKVYTKLNTYVHSGSFEGWIKRIITNTAIEYYRKKVEFKDFDEIEIQNSISIPDDTSMEVEELITMIQSLPTGYRMIFNLYAIEGYSHSEIAEQLNISEGTSKSQLARARALLQKKLHEINKIKQSPIQPKSLILRLLC